MTTTLKYFFFIFSLNFRKSFNDFIDNTIYSYVFESLSILKIYSLSALFSSCSMTAKMTVINDKTVQNSQMAVISCLANV